MDLPKSPRSPGPGSGGWKNRLETLTRRRGREDGGQVEEDVMAELDIMTDNLRNMDTIVTPSTKKSFAAFYPEDYNLRKGFETSYNVFK